MEISKALDMQSKIASATAPSCMLGRCPVHNAIAERTCSPSKTQQPRAPRPVCIGHFRCLAEPGQILQPRLLKAQRGVLQAAEHFQLITRLEDDLQSAVLRQAGPAGEGAVPGSAAQQPGSSMLGIVTNQRDRFRRRCEKMCCACLPQSRGRSALGLCMARRQRTS